MHITSEKDFYLAGAARPKENNTTTQDTFLSVRWCCCCAMGLCLQGKIFSDSDLANTRLTWLEFFFFFLKITLAKITLWESYGHSVPNIRFFKSGHTQTMWTFFFYFFDPPSPWWTVLLNRLLVKVTFLSFHMAVHMVCVCPQSKITLWEITFKVRLWITTCFSAISMGHLFLNEEWHGGPLKYGLTRTTQIKLSDDLKVFLLLSVNLKTYKYLLSLPWGFKIVKMVKKY